MADLIQFRAGEKAKASEVNHNFGLLDKKTTQAVNEVDEKITEFQEEFDNTLDAAIADLKTLTDVKPSPLTLLSGVSPLATAPEGDYWIQWQMPVMKAYSQDGFTVTDYGGSSGSEPKTLPAWHIFGDYNADNHVKLNRHAANGGPVRATLNFPAGTNKRITTIKTPRIGVAEGMPANQITNSWQVTLYKNNVVTYQEQLSGLGQTFNISPANCDKITIDNVTGTGLTDWSAFSAFEFVAQEFVTLAQSDTLYFNTPLRLTDNRGTLFEKTYLQPLDVSGLPNGTYFGAISFDPDDNTVTPINVNNWLGNLPTKPVSAVAGDTCLNTSFASSLLVVERYNGTEWIGTKLLPPARQGIKFDVNNGIASNVVNLPFGHNGYMGAGQTVIEHWQSADGLSWYRKWSDGWVEQGGWIITGAQTNTYLQTVNFLVPMASNKYDITVTPLTSVSGTTAPAKVYLPTTTSVQIGWHGNNVAVMMAYACTYKIEGWAA